VFENSSSFNKSVCQDQWIIIIIQQSAVLMTFF